MSSPAYDIALILQELGVGIISEDLYIGRQPDSPAACVTIFDVGGPSPNPVWCRDEPEYNILIRGEKNDYNGAWEKATEVKDAILGLADQTIDDSIYALFHLRTDTTLISYDSSNRPNLSQNWRCNRDYTVAQGNRQVIA